MYIPANIYTNAYLLHSLLPSALHTVPSFPFSQSLIKPRTVTPIARRIPSAHILASKSYSLPKRTRTPRRNGGLQCWCGGNDCKPGTSCCPRNKDVFQE